MLAILSIPVSMVGLPLKSKEITCLTDIRVFLSILPQNSSLCGGDILKENSTSSPWRMQLFSETVSCVSEGSLEVQLAALWACRQGWLWGLLGEAPTALPSCSLPVFPSVEVKDRKGAPFTLQQEVTGHRKRFSGAACTALYPLGCFLILIFVTPELVSLYQGSSPSPWLVPSTFPLCHLLLKSEVLSGFCLVYRETKGAPEGETQHSTKLLTYL